MTAPVFALAVLALGGITATTMYLRRHPIWQGPGQRHHGSPPRPPRQHPAPRDWGESRLPSAADRTAQFAAIAAGERVMPGRRDGIPHADKDWDLAPWDEAAVPVTPEPALPPLPPAEYLTAPVVTHAPPDVAPGRVHDGCDLSDTGQQAALTLLNTDYAEPGILVNAVQERHPGLEVGLIAEDGWTESDQAICLCGKVPDLPGEPVTSEADCPAHGEPGLDREALETGTMIPGPGPSSWREIPDATLTDMRPVPAPVAARENAAARFSLKAHVTHTIAWKPPLRAYVEDVIGTSPAEDWDRLLEQARAGAVSDGG
jgi:hypothetical protein